MSNIKRKNSSEPSWGEIFKSFKDGIIGSNENFDDDFEEVEENQESPKPAQKSAPEAVQAPAQKPASESTPAQVQKPVSGSVSAPVQESFPAQKSGESAEAIIWRALQADLNRFVQEGKASESFLQLLKEGFEKNPKLLHQITELVESRKVEERTHPGYLLEYNGNQSMFTSKERAFEFFSQRPGSTIKETIFVSKIVNGKVVETCEATEEEKKLYYKQQSSKSDASVKDQ